MPQREEPFYNAYSYGDKLEPGQKIRVRGNLASAQCTGDAVERAERPET